MILAVSRFRVVNGREDAVHTAFLKRPHLVDDVSGFLGMEVFTDARDRAIFYLMTRWTDAASFESWHGSEAHRKSHAGIPQGLKLDPSFTETLQLARLKDVEGAPELEELAADASPLLARYLETTGTVCLLVAELNGSIRHCSPKLAELLARPQEEILGRMVWEFLPEREGSELREKVARGERGSREKLYLNPVDRHHVPHTIECLFDVQPDGFILLGEAPRKKDDLFQEDMMRLTNELSIVSREHAQQSRVLKQTLAELKAAQAKLVHQEKMTALGQMTAGVAHEINNPVSFVVNNHNTLRRDFDDVFSLVNLVGDSLEEMERACPEVAERILARSAAIDLAHLAEAIPRKLGDNLEGLDRVRRIVLDLRNFARLDECDVKSCDVAEGVRAALRFLTPLLDRAGVAIVTEFPPLPPVICSAGHLNQAVGSVVTNAIQASAAGQVVNVSTAHEPGYFSVIVEDHGHGIAPENLSKIFDPFFTTRPIGEGTGLGLSIAYRIMQAHHGDIQIESTLGKGTRVRLRIPLTPPATTATHQAHSAVLA